MKREIQAELNRIETDYGVQVLFAVESGSRAWGFASRDSDYDVSYIYTHEPAWYLLRQNQPGMITEQRGQIALRGWDVRKALGLLRNSDPQLLEWLKSPIIYGADPEFSLLFGHLANEAFSPRRCFAHYLRQAQRAYQTYLEGDKIALKDHFAVLRPLLACRWIERGLGPAPVKFEKLVDTLVQNPLTRIHIAVLVARKRAGEDLDRAQRIPIISQFLEAELSSLTKGASREAEDRDPGTEELEALLDDLCLAQAA